MFAKLAEVLRALRGPTDRERELAYLSAARDRYDLEYRERQIDRGLFRKQSFNLTGLSG